MYSPERQLVCLRFVQLSHLLAWANLTPQDEMVLADWSSGDSSEWIRSSRASRCSYRIKNDWILLLHKLNTFSEVIQTFTPLDLLLLSCNSGMNLKHIPRVWRFWFGMVSCASLISKSSKSTMGYAVNHYSIWTPPVAHFFLEGVDYICHFRKVRFHKLFDWWGTYGCESCVCKQDTGFKRKGIMIKEESSVHQIKGNRIIVRFIWLRQGQIFTCSLELRMDLPVIQRASPMPPGISPVHLA